MSASLAVQRALVAALGGLGCSVFDGVPADAAMPYLTLGPDITGDWSSKTSIGREHRVSVSVWDAGLGTAGVKLLLSEVEDAVLAIGGTHGGHRIAQVLFVRSFVQRDPEGASHGIAEFRIRSERV